MKALLGVNVPEELTWGGIEEFIAKLTFFESLGIEVLEISPVCFNMIRACHLDKRAVRKFLDIISTYNFKYTVHAPNEVNLADEYLQKYSLKILEACIKLATMLESKVIVVHSGYIVPPKETLSRVFWSGIKNVTYTEPNPKVKKQGMITLTNGLKLCAKALEEYEVILGLENGDLGITHLCHRVEELEVVLKEVESNMIGITLDIGHLFLCSNVLGFDFLESIKKALPLMVHLHLSDNFGLYHPAFPDHSLIYGFGDLHLPLGWGKVPFRDVIASVKNDYKGIYLIEIDPVYGKEGYQDSVAMMKMLLSN